MLAKGDNLHAKSGEVDQFQGYVVADMNADDRRLSFTNGVTLTVGNACGDVTGCRAPPAANSGGNPGAFRTGEPIIWLRDQGSDAVLSRWGGEVSGVWRQPGEGSEHARIFEDEYKGHLNEALTLQPSEYNEYLKRIEPGRTHEGYFSIDEKSRRLVDPDVGARSAERTSDDVDAYDLILRRKAQLLSFEEPVRFIFAHSALREGWDNPNVFVIGMLQKADPENVTSRRQEVGRGLRLCVNQRGDRMDNPATVHDLNVLTVVAAEGYK
jgi:type III restriction enzyme